MALAKHRHPPLCGRQKKLYTVICSIREPWSRQGHFNFLCKLPMSKDWSHHSPSTSLHIWFYCSPAAVLTVLEVALGQRVDFIGLGAFQRHQLIRKEDGWDVEVFPGMGGLLVYADLIMVVNNICTKLWDCSHGQVYWVDHSMHNAKQRMKVVNFGQPWFATAQHVLAGIAGKSLKGILHQYLTYWQVQRQRAKQGKLRRAHIWIFTKSHDSEYNSNMKHWNLNTRKMLRHFNATRAHEVDCRSLLWQCHHRPPWLGQEACQVSCSVLQLRYHVRNSTWFIPWLASVTFCACWAHISERDFRRLFPSNQSGESIWYTFLTMILG